jgi:hypothetical protein
MANITAIILYILYYRINGVGSQVIYIQRGMEGTRVSQTFYLFFVTQLISWLNIIGNLSFVYTFFETMSVIGESANDIY